MASSIAPPRKFSTYLAACLSSSPRSRGISALHMSQSWLCGTWIHQISENRSKASSHYKKGLNPTVISRPSHPLGGFRVILARNLLSTTYDGRVDRGVWGRSHKTWSNLRMNQTRVTNGHKCNYSHSLECPGSSNLG
jgi:hypothetical protein